MALIFPSAIKLIDENNLSFKGFDAVFYDAVEAAKDGYFVFSAKDNEEVYLFVVGGRPFASGRADRDGQSFLDIREFFETYLRRGAADIKFYKVEKKLLLSILVYFRKRPVQKFTADMVDMEKVLRELEAKGLDSIIVARCGDKMGFSLCIKGRPSFNYFSEEVHAAEQPRDALLFHIFGEKDAAQSIEIFEDIHITPSEDAIPPKGKMPGSLTEHYVEPFTPSSVSGATVALIFEGKVIKTHTVIKKDTIIGRLEGSDIMIENPGVSRHHAIIREGDGKFIIEDNGSANGTFINGERVTKREIKDGDNIQILKYNLLFRYPLPPVAEDTEKTMYVAPPAATPVKKPAGAARLVLEDGTELPLKSTIMTIGKGEDMELKIDGFLIATHQASILRGKEGEFILVHKGGMTATKVNGEKINEHPLKNGDVIEIGKHKISYMVS